MEAVDRLSSSSGGLARRELARRLHRRRHRPLVALGRAWARPDPWPLRRVQLELVNRCNLRCPLCRTLLDDGVPRRRMERDEMIRILEPVAATLESVTLYGTRGEPLLHRELEACVAWIKRRTRARVSISSNGTLLSARRVAPLLDSGLDELIVAVDGLTQETYRRYRVGGDLTLVLENLRRFCEARDSGGYATRVVLQMIPMSTNEHEIDRLGAVAAAAGVDRARLKLSSSVALDPALRPSDPALAAAPPRARGELDCPFGLDKLYVDPNGDCYPCCYAEGRREMRLGNALESGTLEVWRSALAWSLRQGFARGTGHHPFCVATCAGRPPRRKIRVDLEETRGALAVVDPQ